MSVSAKSSVTLPPPADAALELDDTITPGPLLIAICGAGGLAAMLPLMRGVARPASRASGGKGGSRPAWFANGCAQPARAVQAANQPGDTSR